MRCDHCGQDFPSQRPRIRQVLDRVLYFCSEKCTREFDRLGLHSGPEAARASPDPAPPPIPR